jgi:hypothetical protein
VCGRFHELGMRSRGIARLHNILREPAEVCARFGGPPRQSGFAGQAVRHRVLVGHFLRVSARRWRAAHSISEEEGRPPSARGLRLRTGISLNESPEFAPRRPLIWQTFQKESPPTWLPSPFRTSSFRYIPGPATQKLLASGASIFSGGWRKYGRAPASMHIVSDPEVVGSPDLDRLFDLSSGKLLGQCFFH